VVQHKVIGARNRKLSYKRDLNDLDKTFEPMAIVTMNRTDIREHYWLPLQAIHKVGATEVLEAAYSNPERGYHSWSHISDLLELLEHVSEFAVRPDLITIAIFDLL
jgi:hypothetical protein